MAGEEQAGGAGGLRGQTETAGGEGCLDGDLGEAGDERAALQPFFQGPGGIVCSPGLNDEKARRVEPSPPEGWAVRASPFPALSPRQAPQYEPATICLRRCGDHGQGEAEGRRGVAIAFRLELVEARLLELL